MWPHKRGSVHVKFSMTGGQEKGDLLIQVTVMSRFDCIKIYKMLHNYLLYFQWGYLFIGIVIKFYSHISRKWILFFLSQDINILLLSTTSTLNSFTYVACDTILKILKEINWYIIKNIVCLFQCGPHSGLHITKNIVCLFQCGPHSGLHIIIFDEIDAICKARGSVVSRPCQWCHM
jgi:hypothetical protein